MPVFPNLNRGDPIVIETPNRTFNCIFRTWYSGRFGEFVVVEHNDNIEYYPEWITIKKYGK